VAVYVAPAASAGAARAASDRQLDHCPLADLELALGVSAANGQCDTSSPGSDANRPESGDSRTGMTHAHPGRRGAPGIEHHAGRAEDERARRASRAHPDEAR